MNCSLVFFFPFFATKSLFLPPLSLPPVSLDLNFKSSSGESLKREPSPAKGYFNLQKRQGSYESASSAQPSLFQLIPVTVLSQRWLSFCSSHFHFSIHPFSSRVSRVTVRSTTFQTSNCLRMQNRGTRRTCVLSSFASDVMCQQSLIQIFPSLKPPPVSCPSVSTACRVGWGGEGEGGLSFFLLQIWSDTSECASANWSVWGST